MSKFGWSLPPGCTHRMIEDAAGNEQPCAVCCLDCADCVCPECPTCTAQGDPTCYEKHGLKLNKEQAISRQNMGIFIVAQRLDEEKQHLEYLKSADDKATWELDDVADPWR